MKNFLKRINIPSLIVLILIATGIGSYVYYKMPDVVEYDRAVTQFKTVQIEITNIDPPPFYDIDFKSLDGTLKGKMESRKCDEWKNIKVGDIYTLNYNTITKSDEGKVVYKEINLPNACTFAKYAKVVKYAEVI